MSSQYYQRHPAPNVVFPGLDRQNRTPSRKKKNIILNYEISTCISHMNFGRIILYLSMNPDVINGWEIGGLAGHHSACQSSECRNFIGANASRYCLHIFKTVSFCLVLPEVQLMLRSSNRFPRSFSSTVGGGRSENLAVLIIDNASFHHSNRIKQLCSEVARVQRA